jgi:SAM-dependent methyltransferase
MSETLDSNYWQTRWNEGKTGWDIGHASTPIAGYIDQLSDKSIKILIPGCGNAWEGEYLISKGFHNTWVIDIAPAALESLSRRFPHFPKEQLIEGDFFEHKGSYDLIIEQTFFCALDPALRRKYAEKMHELLTPGGRLVGLLFDAKLNDDHPPFGGSRTEYLTYFENIFDLHTFQTAHNSIKPRAGSELFINLIKKA